MGSYYTKLVWERSNQTRACLAAMLALADSASDLGGGAVVVSHDTLEGILRASNRTVRRILTELEDVGELAIEKRSRGRGKPNLYRILIDETWPCHFRYGAIPTIHRAPLKVVISDQNSDEKVVISDQSESEKVVISDQNEGRNAPNPSGTGIASYSVLKSNSINVPTVHAARCAAPPFAEPAERSVRDVGRTTRKATITRKTSELWRELERLTGDTEGTYRESIVRSEVLALSIFDPPVTVDELRELVEVWWWQGTWQGRKGEGARLLKVRQEVGQYRKWVAGGRKKFARPQKWTAQESAVSDAAESLERLGLSEIFGSEETE